MIRILLVDDDPRYRAIIERLLLRFGHFAVTSASTEMQARKALERENFDLVLLDLYIDGRKSWETLQRAAAHPGKPVPILFSGEDTPGNADRAASLGAYAFLAKPFDFARLIATVDSALGSRIRNIPDTGTDARPGNAPSGGSPSDATIDR